ncbi:hypothetical protein FisN_28Lh098 [Fistulifera solaris]|uniref:N-acetyltransferase domain-containing protein n=1 Tax=Fistulifera solaris TaxID=1519565 RepID=A0A1Z5K5C0_FISSO|nr:hypothetical protein FisN_28Lh098 [Fistulifera solaris]|eukprot:GAX21406.1 hypothetical protein FisN_28Lh098 [Fistulifera solaris]
MRILFFIIFGVCLVARSHSFSLTSASFISSATANRSPCIAFAVPTKEVTALSPPTSISFHDLRWKVKLPENAKLWERLQYSGNRFWETFTQGSNELTTLSAPFITPRSSGNSQVVLEAYLPAQFTTEKPVIRMGFTTQAGPPLPLLETTLQKLNFEIDDEGNNIRTMALIFIWIDPEYRGLQWGVQAMRIVRYIHFSMGADCTVIVANDKGSGRLVSWYEQQGFVQALELQDCLGSPNQIYGTAMVGRTLAEKPLRELTMEYSYC